MKLRIRLFLFAFCYGIRIQTQTFTIEFPKFAGKATISELKQNLKYENEPQLFNFNNIGSISMHANN